MTEPWTTEHVRVGDLVLDVRSTGPDDGAPVLLLHGFPQSSRSWTRVAQRLPGLRLVAPDQRGYSPGARPADVAAYATAELGGDVLGLLDALGLESAHLVGHDWGSTVAWWVAAHHPERLRTLTAVSIPHLAAYGAALAADPDQQARSAYIRDFRQPAPGPEDTLLADDAAGLRAAYGGAVAEEDVAAYVALMREGALTPALNWYRAMGPDLGALPPVEVPTTYVWSDGDRFAGRAAAEGCGEHVRADYRFVELPGVSHWIPDEAPDALAAAIRDRTGVA